MSDRRLVIFDVDGTLIDSQAHILRALGEAYDSVGRVMPEPRFLLSVVGLSLTEMFDQLAPDLTPCKRQIMQAAYKTCFAAIHQGAAPSPLFAGVADGLNRLGRDPQTVMALATGNSRRGLDRILDLYGWAGHFRSTQSATEHPSKPHPAMIQAAMAETGIGPDRTVMIGDTRWDIDMARAAGVAAIAVDWGYHTAATLGADAVLTRFGDLSDSLDAIMEPAR